jgi:hypothetical protein
MGREVRREERREVRWEERREIRGEMRAVIGVINRIRKYLKIASRLYLTDDRIHYPRVSRGGVSWSSRSYIKIS